jgi:hypothetical protein
MISPTAARLSSASWLAGELSEPQVTAGPVEHGGDRGAVERSDDEVAFEVADRAAPGGFGRPGVDQVELPERRSLGHQRFAGLAATFAAATATVHSGVQTPAQTPGAVGVDPLVDALVGDQSDQAVGAAGEFDRDRHRRVLRLEPRCHMRGEHGIGHEFGGLRARPLLVGSDLRCGRAVAAPATVAVDLAADRGPVPTQPAGDLGVRAGPADPHADLLAPSALNGSAGMAAITL